MYFYILNIWSTDQVFKQQKSGCEGLIQRILKAFEYHLLAINTLDTLIVPVYLWYIFTSSQRLDEDFLSGVDESKNEMVQCNNDMKAR